MNVEINNVDNSIYYNFGKEVFGPFLYGFVSWMNEKIKQIDVDKIWFLSRDGYLIQKAYERISDNIIPYSYFYCSRKSLRNALLWRLDTYEDSIKYVNVQKRISVGYMLEYYGFSQEEGQNIIDKMGVQSDYSVEYANLSECDVFVDIFEQNKEKIIARSKEQDDLLIKYIEQIGISPNLAIVDVGWHGSMQYYFEEFFKNHSIDVRITGLYVGIYSFYDLIGKTFGFLFESGSDLNRKKVMCSHGIIEKFLQSLEGSTSMYLNNEGNIIPVNLEYEYKDDKRVISIIESWQTAAIECVVLLNETHNQVDFTQYADRFIRFGMSPNLRDISIFKFMYNYDGEYYYYTSQKPIYRYGFGELRNALLKSPWKTGFMKSLFKISLPYYWIYEMVS